MIKTKTKYHLISIKYKLINLTIPVVGKDVKQWKFSSSICGIIKQNDHFNNDVLICNKICNKVCYPKEKAKCNSLKKILLYRFTLFKDI